MTSSTPFHRRPRRSSLALVAAAAVAGSALPLLASTATAGTLLPGPSVVGPADAGPVLKEVVLDWAGVPGATGYVVQVGTDDEWSDKPTLELKSVASRITVPASLPHASYVWRVAALGEDGQGRWSANGTFTRGWTTGATPLTPGRGTHVGPEAGRPTFSWAPVPTASEYQLQVSTSPHFDAPFRTTAEDKTEACFTTRTSVTPFTGQANAKNDGAGECTFTLLGTGQERYWRVRPLDHVVDGAAEVDTTPIVDEGINSRPPEAEPGSLDTSACGTGAKPVAASPAPSAEPSSAPSVAPSAAPAPAGSGSCEPAHTVEKGPWSVGIPFRSTYPTVEKDTTQAFRSLSAIDSPALSTDVCKDGLCRDFPTVSWGAVPGASRYRLYVALDAQYNNIQAIIETSGLQWTPTDQWRESTAGASYYVLVQPCTTAGCGAVGKHTVFRKSSPRLAPALPADGTLTNDREVLLTWQSAAQALSAAIGGPATSEAYAYDVQVTTTKNPDFHTGGLVDSARVDGTHHLSSEKTYEDGSYLWRVQAVGASGHKQPWSATRSFVLDTTPPTFTVSPTTKVAVNGSVKVVFSEQVKGISAETVRISDVAASVTAAADGLSATLVPSKPLMPGQTHAVSVTSGVSDLAGNAVAPVSVSLLVDPMVDDRSPAMGLGGSWTRLTASNAVNGTFSRSVPTPTRQTAATVALYGRGAEVKGCVGPGNGVIELWADGIRLTRIDTYRSFSGCGVVLTRAPFKTGDGAHRIQVRGVGVKNAKSTGTAIAIDAITAVK